ncbi:hypothetical protein RJT34_30433 [Clitoria ternatea]|uniref:Uncharacterized protein n=1 Tax=Clitoria ternatea TaxID=43366 RepID=A0AAN9I1Z2_CLITE
MNTGLSKDSPNVIHSSPSSFSPPNQHFCPAFSLVYAGFTRIGFRSTRRRCFSHSNKGFLGIRSSVPQANRSKASFACPWLLEGSRGEDRRTPQYRSRERDSGDVAFLNYGVRFLRERIFSGCSSS